MSDVVIALDCGTHAARSLAVEVASGACHTCATEPIPLLFPQPGWVEVDPEVLASAAVQVVREAVSWAASEGHSVVALGVANMRETALTWRRSDHAPAYPGIMWMSQQSAPTVTRWREQGFDPVIRERTGLSNDAFFFGSKLAWLLEHEPDVRRLADTGDLAVGTVESWLLYRLSGGEVHRTDLSNGSRTQLMNLSECAWDQQMCDLLQVPMDCLPTLTGNMAHYGVTDADVCGAEIPMTGVVADQQASLLGHGCERAGDMKATFGTSGVVTLNTGEDMSLHEGMVTSVGWQDERGQVQYEVEGSAFHSGYTMGWLSEHTGHPVEFDVDPDRQQVPASHRVYVLPSFSAMGAPRWTPGHGAVIAGLSMDTTNRDIMQAGLEAMAFQAYDLFAAMGAATADTTEVNVDGGGADSDYVCQLFADLMQVDVLRPQIRELTSVGAAKAAIRGAGLEADRHLGQDRSQAKRFHPRQGHTYATEGYQRWVELVETTLR